MEFKKEFNSQEELEQLLDEEFVSDEEISDDDVTEEDIESNDDLGDDITNEEEIEETQDDKEVVDDKENDDEEEVVDDEEIQEEEQTQVKTKIKKEDKQSYAFKKLREELKTYKEELKQTKPQIERLDNIAKRYGYQSHEEMLKVLEEQALEREAKEQNIDPAIYKKMKELEYKYEQLEREKQEALLQAKVEKFLSSFNDFAKEYSLTDEEKESVLLAMDEDGWQLEQLLTVRNPKNIFKGYIADKIAEKKTQKTLKDITKNSKYAEETFKNTGQVDKTIDELVAEDLKEWARKNGYSF